MNWHDIAFFRAKGRLIDQEGTNWPSWSRRHPPAPSQPPPPFCQLVQYSFQVLHFKQNVEKLMWKIDLHKRGLEIEIMFFTFLQDQLPESRMTPWLKVEHIYTTILGQEQNWEASVTESVTRRFNLFWRQFPCNHVSQRLKLRCLTSHNMTLQWHTSQYKRSPLEAPG